MQNTSRLTETFEVLAHPHRRYVLYHLACNSGVTGTDALAAAIARWNVESGADRTTSIDTIRIALYHSHLPKLADAGFITVDRNSDAVELEDSDTLDSFLGDAASIDECAHLSLSAGADRN
ncbi:helix-turn-helix domain-containing protein [Halomicroarcula sp. F28]|uniref:helix-turn-helix domain-containing protein n=1 Tax=Haloarcula salinisoli TaxID=2487746 RepID=UPI001C7301A4|nr:helix-turn-helix domain-containing protein [Halomicroarcula salinisoli]MBX0288234.1 helix-turn-helix domain-containing protein [Halomicroarcula salinisoli]